MLWVTWTIPPLVSSLVLCFAVLVIWAAEPQVTHLNILSVLVCLLLGLSLAPERSTAFLEAISGVVTALITEFRLDGLLLSHTSMLVSGAALIWLLRRAVQTLWKPVPELIEILGVEVPVPPDVSLTAIGVDKATITWTRPPSNRSVEKYVIQVNGVNVGESATSHDTFITVSGLKPNHFYNVRIIAVGSNNFQAGSRVLRLRTFGSDGRPRLGSARLPSEFTDDDAASASRQQDGAGGDENGSVKQFVTSTFGVAQPLPSDGLSALSRESTSSTGLAPSSRRNTVNRRHSPSTASLDQQQQQQANPPTTAASGADEDGGVTEEQMAELNQRYLNLRKETEETMAMIAKEEEEMKKLLEELEKEKQTRRKEHRRKEEQTEKLKREQGATERTMRASLQRKAQKEKKLKEKSDELERLHENIEKWEKSIKEMREEQLSYNQQRTELDEEHQTKTNELRDSSKAAQDDCTRLETELKEKRRQVKELEDERTTLVSNGDDAEWRASIVELRKQWHRRDLDYREALLHENRRAQGLDGHISILSAQLQQIPQQNFGAYNPASGATGLANFANPANIPSPSGFDFDPASAQNHLKRRSRASNSLSSAAAASPIPTFSLTDVNGLPPASTPPYVSVARPPTQSGFLTGPFMGNSADHPGTDGMDEAGFKALTAGAPLSPSATSLLPSNIFADDDPPSPSLNARALSPFIPMESGAHDLLGNLNNHASKTAGSNSSSNNSDSNIADTSHATTTWGGTVPNTAATAGPTPAITANNDPQSPTSSNRSMSILSSPRDSSQNIPFPAFSVETVDGQPRPGSGLPSPTADPSALPDGQSSNKPFGLFSFQRSRGAKALDEGGPALGTLKHGQSQSFPRQGEDVDGNKFRRISLSSFSVFNRNSAGPELIDSQFSPASVLNRSSGFSARNLFPFGSRPSASILAERDPSSPRPASMASIDMPRPSTDSGSIWGPPGDNGAASTVLGKASRLWPSDNGWPSRNPSRRPSIHGSPSALKTNLASADDEILDEEELLNPETSPSQVGVIGSRPPAAVKKASAFGKALNPAAPTFMGSIFRPKTDKDRDKDSEKEKPKGKDKGKGKAKKDKDQKDKNKDKGKDKDNDKAKPSAQETPAAATLPSLVVDESPSDARLSRDGLSVRTQTSVSESRESLDYVVSNTASEPNSLGMLSSSKDSSDNALLKLFRKESTSKLSFSRRIGRNKGTGSVAGSDKNMSVGRSSFGDFEDIGDDSALSASGSRGTGVGIGSPGGVVGGADSVTSSPSLGPSKSREKVDSKLKAPGWFSIKKKNREKESLELDRERGLGEPDSTASSLATSASAATENGEKKAA